MPGTLMRESTASAPPQISMHVGPSVGGRLVSVAAIGGAFQK